MTDDQLRKLDELLDVEDGLSPREVEFIESLNHQRGRDLTARQEKWLDDIFGRVCG